jgi:oligopeptide/dipeptide ABC transporter ATP-binding protein
MTEPLLRVEHVRQWFPLRAGLLFDRTIGHVRAVDDVSFTLARGETLGLVGESGCGKSTLARTIMRLQKPTAGRIVFDGQDISTAGRRALKPLRRDAQLVFQDPYASLNPRRSIGNIVGAPLARQGVKRRARRARVGELLGLVGLPASAAMRYPHEFSGGQRQRVGIARALAVQPKLIVLDEPVSALDVSIQAQIVNLLDDLQRDLDLSYLFVAHDLAVVRHVSHRVAVMYLGRIVEVSPAEELYTRPIHPYTDALLRAIPVPEPAKARRQRASVGGEPPSPIDPPSGCVFHTRCPRAQDRCRAEVPPLMQYGDGHGAACHFPLNVNGDQAANATRSPDSPEAAGEAAPEVLSDTTPA